MLYLLILLSLSFVHITLCVLASHKQTKHYLLIIRAIDLKWRFVWSIPGDWLSFSQTSWPDTLFKFINPWVRMTNEKMKIKQTKALHGTIGCSRVESLERNGDFYIGEGVLNLSGNVTFSLERRHSLYLCLECASLKRLKAR